MSTDRHSNEYDQADENFVINGRKTPIRMKCNERTYLTNSEKTLSSCNLSNTSLNRSGADWGSINDVLFDSANSSNFRDTAKQSKRKKPKETGGELSLDLRSLNSSLNKSLNKSVSFNTHLPKKTDYDSDDELEDMFKEELQRLIDKDEQENEEQTQEPDLVGKPHHQNSHWFTEPVHLTKSTEYPVFESLGVEMDKTSLRDRTGGIIGTQLAQQKRTSEILLDDLAQEYFPVTLGTMRSVTNTLSQPLSTGTMRSLANTLSHRPSSTMSHCPMANTLSQPPHTGALLSHRTSSTMSHRPMSAQSETLNTSYATRRRSNSALNLSQRNPKLEASSDYNYLQASQQFINESLTATPHQYELAKLRMERLRLEEERILESKRQEELERIRGPTPKWYEMKSPHFTYEHYKHNQLLKSKDRWQELMDYRNKLTSSSREFSKAHSPSQTSLFESKRAPSRASTISSHPDDSGYY